MNLAYVDMRRRIWVHMDEARDDDVYVNLTVEREEVDVGICLSPVVRSSYTLTLKTPSRPDIKKAVPTNHVT